MARNGSAVPGGVPEGYVFNTTTGINGLSSGNNIAAGGAMLVAGNINGPNNTTSLDTAAFLVGADGTGALMAREGDPCPGTAGAVMSASFALSSGIQINDAGAWLYSTATLGGDTVTTNNAALVLFSPTAAPSLVFRKGAAAPGFSDGTTMTPDTFQYNINGAGNVEFGGTLVGGSATTADDKARFTTAGSTGGALRMWIREGSVMPGTNGLVVKATTLPSVSNHPLMADGSIIFATSVSGGDSVAGVTDSGVFREKEGNFTTLHRRGDSIAGITDGTLQSVNFSSFLVNANGLLACQAILQNPDGTAMTANSTFVGYSKNGSGMTSILRQGQELPGEPGTLVASLNGSTSICVSDSGVIVFSASLGTAGSAIMAWDETNGLRTIFRSGNTTLVPGKTLNSVILIGGAGVNGDSGNTGINPTGLLVFKVRDTVAAYDALVSIKLDAGTPCPADVDNSGAVDAADLTILLSGWGGSGSGDIDGSGTVDGLDLGAVLSGWGNCG